MSRTQPRSTSGSSTSCCALLKRWISSMNRIVFAPLVREPVRGGGDHAPHVGDVAFHAAQPLEPRLRGARDDLRQRRLARARRAEENDRRNPVRLDRAPEQFARPEDVLLPAYSSSVSGRIRVASGTDAGDAAGIDSSVWKRSAISWKNRRTAGQSSQKFEANCVNQLRSCPFTSAFRRN